MLTYLLLAFVLLGLSGAAYWLWRRRINADLQAGAQAEFERLEHADPALLQGLDLPRFSEIYARTNEPRFPGYALLAFAIFVLSAPFVLGIVDGTFYLAARGGLLAQPGEVATNLYIGSDSASVIRRVSPETFSYVMQGWSGLLYFLVLLGLWLVIGFVLMRRYHRRTPGTLREEVLRSR
jgi:hypothetical protein